MVKRYEYYSEQKQIADRAYNISYNIPSEMSVEFADMLIPRFRDCVWKHCMIQFLTDAQLDERSTEKDELFLISEAYQAITGNRLSISINANQFYIILNDNVAIVNVGNLSKMPEYK